MSDEPTPRQVIEDMARLAGQLDAMKPDTRGRYVGTHPDRMFPASGQYEAERRSDLREMERRINAGEFDFIPDYWDGFMTVPGRIMERIVTEKLQLINEVRAARRLADIAAERAAVDSFIRDRIGPDGGQVVLPDGDMFIISRNTVDADKYPWRVTRFVKQPDGQVVAAGHDVAKELDNPGERGAYPPGAVQVLAGYIRLADTLNAPPPPQNKPTLASQPASQPTESQTAPAEAPSSQPQPTTAAIEPFATTKPEGFSWDAVPKRAGATTHPDRILFDPDAPEVPPGDIAYLMGQGDGLDGLSPEPPPAFMDDYQRGYDDGVGQRTPAATTVAADDPRALDGPENAERANDAVRRRINTLAGKAKVPAAAWKALEDLVHTDPVAAMAYARQKSLDRTADALHDLEATGAIRREADGYAGPGMSRA